MKRHQFLDFISAIDGPSDINTWSDTQMNWQDNLDRAGKLGIGPLVYARMKQNGVTPFVPKAIIEVYKSRFYWNQVQNMKRLGRLKAVLMACASERIPIMVLKGAALAGQVYPEIGWRPMQDVDLLAHEADIPRIEQLVISLGYRPNEKKFSKDWYQNHHHIVPYISSDHSLILEIHRHLVRPSHAINIPIAELWERACPAHIAGVACWILSPEDMLIHLSLHLVDDAYFGKVRILFDIAATVDHFRGDINWDQLLQLAQTYRISKHLYYAFWLARVTVRAEVPASALNTLKTRFRSLPLEDWLFKAVTQKVIVFYTREKHPFYFWWITAICPDFLATQTRSETLRITMHGIMQKYTKYSCDNAQNSWMPPWLYHFVGYPFYLAGKTVGLYSRPETHNRKRSQ
jgi:hypothetical protein